MVIALLHTDFPFQSSGDNPLACLLLLDGGCGDRINGHVMVLGKKHCGPANATAGIQNFHAGLKLHDIRLVAQQIAQISGSKRLNDIAINLEKGICRLIVKFANCLCMRCRIWFGRAV